MRTRFILYTGGALLCGLCVGMAGSRSGGSGAGAVTIPADTLDQGGAAATAGTGATAVRIQASVGGVIGTATAAAPAVNNRQGYIPQVLSSVVVSGYALWVAVNIPAGQDDSFNGDGAHIGLPNGVLYALSWYGNWGWNPIFGQGVLSPSREGMLAPFGPIPEDVDLYIDRSLTLTAGSWTPVASWVNGADPVFASGVQLYFYEQFGEIQDSFAGPKAYYRYRAVKR